MMFLNMSNNFFLNVRAKQLWTVSDSKKKELDALLDRAQAAVSGLLNIFVNVAGPFFKNSRQVFHDILAIFKRCKEVEKILKSSFFEDEEIADLIADIKHELRKEKTAKLARHIAEVYKYRNTTLENEKPESKATDKSAKSENGNSAQFENKDDVSSQENGAVGGETDLKEESEVNNIKKALIEYGSNIDDPIMQIIFDTSLHTTIAESAKKKLLNNQQQQSENSSENSSAGNAVESASDIGNVKDLVNKKSVSDIIQTVIDSVCDNSDQELTAAFQAVKQNVQLACDGIDKVEESIQAGTQSGREQTGSEGDSSQRTRQAGVQSTNMADSQDEKLEETLLPPNHRTLCIRVCKALNVRLLHVKQEVNRKWLAYKFGCNENVSDIELFEKMQAKMIESVESGKGPLQLSSETNDGSLASSTECIKELESLEDRRASLDNGVDDQNGEKDEAVENVVINGDVEEKGKLMWSF